MAEDWFILTSLSVDIGSVLFVTVEREIGSRHLYRPGRKSPL